MSGFTLPGEAGKETLTLELAKRWGADVIRDSDGTALSDELLNAGYGIYSTICPIRGHNEWLREHPNARQRTFLCTAPKTAVGRELSFSLLNGFFDGQFDTDDSPESMAYWQVYDRTEDVLLPPDKWRYDARSGAVVVTTEPWRQYTVSFMAWRVWEEISMYNHVTNGWTSERLVPLNPYEPSARAYLRGYMERWCAERPTTTVVRFTSLFYNFAWIWGSDGRNRNLFSDWASYDFTVCPAALSDFEKRYGYALTAEGFVRQGKYNATHRVPSREKRDYMTFIGDFTREAGKELIDVVHGAGKAAYVFCDDSWVGLEPYNGRFGEYGFDGFIKCVFSGYEARFCANVNAHTREIRFHPYLFPVGLGGLPTFSEGGKPEADALKYWVGVRRALLRQSVDRCGLGGYLSLTEKFPAFVETMDVILREFRAIRDLHTAGSPVGHAPKVAVLTAWGALRTWTLSGHFHETDRHCLVHILESLSGLAFDVSFISFEDVLRGALDGVDAVISAGESGDAWSGGVCWNDAAVVERLTAWVHGGGAFIGVNEPSAVTGYNSFFRMAHVLGVDADDGERACHGKWAFERESVSGLIPDGAAVPANGKAFLTDGLARVLWDENGAIALTANDFGAGRGVYLGGFVTNPPNSRLLRNLILYAARGEGFERETCDPYVEYAVFDNAARLAFINNSSEPRLGETSFGGIRYSVELAPFDMEIVDLR